MLHFFYMSSAYTFHNDGVHIETAGITAEEYQSSNTLLLRPAKNTPTHFGLQSKLETTLHTLFLLLVVIYCNGPT